MLSISVDEMREVNKNTKQFSIKLIILIDRLNTSWKNQVLK